MLNISFFFVLYNASPIQGKKNKASHCGTPPLTSQATSPQEAVIPLRINKEGGERGKIDEWSIMRGGGYDGYFLGKFLKIS